MLHCGCGSVARGLAQLLEVVAQLAEVVAQLVKVVAQLVEVVAQLVKVVAQLVERLLPTPEVQSSNPVISKFYNEHCLLSTVLKR